MGSNADGVGRIHTGFYIFSPVGVRLVPLQSNDLKGFRLDFNRTLTGFKPESGTLTGFELESGKKLLYPSSADPISMEQKSRS